MHEPTLPVVAGPSVLADVDNLAAAVLRMCKHRDWSLHWTARGAYLHLESSELIESIRGKGDSTPLAEAADVLLVLMSITENSGIRFSDVVAQARGTCDLLMTKPRYDGEEHGSLAPADQGQAEEIELTCFLLEDDPPEQHGPPIACTHCYNALSELHDQAENRAVAAEQQLAAVREERDAARREVREWSEVACERGRKIEQAEYSLQSQLHLAERELTAAQAELEKLREALEVVRKECEEGFDHSYSDTTRKIVRAALAPALTPALSPQEPVEREERGNG